MILLSSCSSYEPAFYISFATSPFSLIMSNNHKNGSRQILLVFLFAYEILFHIHNFPGIPELRTEIHFYANHSRVVQFYEKHNQLEMPSSSVFIVIYLQNKFFVTLY